MVGLKWKVLSISLSSKSHKIKKNPLKESTPYFLKFQVHSIKKIAFNKIIFIVLIYISKFECFQLLKDLGYGGTYLYHISRNNHLINAPRDTE